MEPDYKKRRREADLQHGQQHASDLRFHAVLAAISGLRSAIRRGTRVQATQFRGSEHWTRWGTYGLWAAAIVGAFAIVRSCSDTQDTIGALTQQTKALNDQASTLKNQVKALRDQISEMRAEHRAWVYADILANPAKGVEVNQSGGFNFYLEFVLHNTGQLPGQFVQPVFEAHTSKYFHTPGNDMAATQQRVCRTATDNLKESIDKDGRMKESERYKHIGVTAFPGQVLPMGGVATISRNDWEDGALPKKFGDVGSDAWVFGCIVYAYDKNSIGFTGFGFSVDRLKPGPSPGSGPLPRDPSTVHAGQVHVGLFPLADVAHAE